MDYWQRVTVEAATQTQSASGAVSETWATYLDDVEARILPLSMDEKLEQWATPEESAYEIQLRGAWAGLEQTMRVLAEGSYFDIRHITLPPPYGEPSTILHCVKVTP